MDPVGPNPPALPPHPKRVWLITASIIGILILTGLVLVLPLGKDSKDGSNTGTNQPATKPVSASADTPELTTTVIVKGRMHIWDMVFLPSKEMLFSERYGMISMLKDAKVREVARIPDVSAKGEGGLMGLAVDPAFTENRYIYACYNATTGDIRVVRWKLADDMQSLAASTPIITGMPANTGVSPGRHSGCRMQFGPDGYLWIGTGDTAQSDIAIRPDSLGGKVLRVDRNGRAAPRNLGGQYDPRIYSAGHRNIQGIAFFPAEKHGTLGITAEHGSSVDDEINELKKGNFGWAPPASQGYVETGVPMTDTQRFPDAIRAIWSSGNSTQAPSGIAVIQGKQWEGWNGALAMAVLKDRHLKILRLDDRNKITKEERVLQEGFGRLRGVTIGPDGSLYVSSSNGTDDRIIKLTSR